ncbi:MAG: PfkB family carbohydrate kinase [Polyangiaceae bacterium]|nr:PfkB family carbohydrate kinase [Polyangiaceae bacterium]
MSPSPVLIVGSMAFDDLQLPSGDFPNVVGGSATYGAYTATAFAPVRLVAVVGHDFPDAHLGQLRDRGADVEGVERKAGETFRWAGRYSQNLASRETLDTRLNVFAHFEPRLPPAYADTPFVLLGNIHPRLQASVLDQIKGARFVVADTMNFWIDGEPKALAEVMKRVDALVINEEEARQLAGEHNVHRAARAVQAMGPRIVIVKRGEYGALLFDEAGPFFAPAYPLEDVLDPTGAGDSFAGGLLGYLATQAAVDPFSLRRAVMVASACASFCVEEVGTARLTRLTRADVSARLEAFHTLLHFGPDPF